MAWVCLLSALAPRPVPAVWQTVEAGRGAVWVQRPDVPPPAAGFPLIVLLHGFGASGLVEELYLGLAPAAAAKGFLYALPDGTENPNGNRFWNATDACCDGFHSGVDDVGYLLDLVDAIAAAIPVDPRRVAFLGHSNGGFMAYRMACSAAERVAAAASLAGATFADADDCQPARPVRILQIHGTQDDRVLYDGGVLLAPYPGAEQSVATWASYDGCLSDPVAGVPFDADDAIPGDETTVDSYAVGCRGSDVELWRIVGGTHLPTFGATFRARSIDWIMRATTTIAADGFESGDLRAWSASAP